MTAPLMDKSKLALDIERYILRWRFDDLQDTKGSDIATTLIALTDSYYLGLIDSMPERGFGMPKVGTPEHAKGTFSKLIDASELRNRIGGSNGAT